MNLISIYPNMSNFGGAQKVLCDLHSGLENFEYKYISSFNNFNILDDKYNINSHEYIKFSFKNFKYFNNSIIISHHRKTTTILEFLIRLKILKAKLIHIAHNEFSNLKYLTLFPKNIITVSNKVKENHIKYFKIDKKNITVIYNGIKNINQTYQKVFNKKCIHILYPARITKVKNQLELIKLLIPILPDNIKIVFAGDGDNLNELKLLVQNDERFEVLGFISNLKDLYEKCDFVMLYSLKEGLPISLLESTMYGKPIICSDVGGNSEIVMNNKNGYLIKADSNLLSFFKNTINSLNYEDYHKLAINSREVFNDKFEYSKMITSYQSYLNNVIIK